MIKHNTNNNLESKLFLSSWNHSMFDLDVNLFPVYSPNQSQSFMETEGHRSEDEDVSRGGKGSPTGIYREDHALLLLTLFPFSSPQWTLSVSSLPHEWPGKTRPKGIFWSGVLQTENARREPTWIPEESRAWGRELIQISHMPHIRSILRTKIMG